MQLSTEDLELIMDMGRKWLSLSEIVTARDEDVRQLMEGVRLELEERYELLSFQSDCGDSCKL